MTQKTITINIREPMITKKNGLSKLYNEYLAYSQIFSVWKEKGSV